MKVLWVEDDAQVASHLETIADKAARARVQIDLVVANSLLAAEARLRLERFDLVLLDLTLPDSSDAEMTVARIANMGTHRIAVVSDREDAARVVETAVACGCNMASQAVTKDALPFNRFIQRPDVCEDFFLALMPEAATASAVAA